MASTGSASTIASVSRFAAVRPDTTPDAGRPASTSIRYWSAPPIAPPPGATLASALPASCEAITGCQRALRNDSSCSAHRQNSAAPCSAAIASSQAGDSRSI